VGAAACLALVLAGCASGTLRLDTPPVSGPTADHCAALVAALPDSLADQPRRTVETSDGPAAAWGDPPIVLRCGVPEPAGWDPLFGSCQGVNGVFWFIPEGQITGQPVDVVMTTVDRAANVEVRIPAEYFPPAAAMAGLADAIKRTVPETKPCV
jgi:hypothetical protein